MPQTSERRRQLLQIINRFYEQPVARVSFELFITVAVILFFAVFAIRPTLLTMSDLIKEIQDKRALDLKMTQKVAALSTGQTTFLNLEGRLQILDQALPKEPRLVEAVKILEKIASDRQIAILGLTTRKLPQDDGPTLTEIEDVGPLARQNLNFMVTVIGDYNSIKDFVADLQNTQRVIIVDSIVFTINEEQTAKTLEATININMPFYGTVSAVDAEAAAATAGATP